MGMMPTTHWLLVSLAFIFQVAVFGFAAYAILRFLRAYEARTKAEAERRSERRNDD